MVSGHGLPKQLSFFLATYAPISIKPFPKPTRGPFLFMFFVLLNTNISSLISFSFPEGPRPLSPYFCLLCTKNMAVRIWKPRRCSRFACGSRMKRVWCRRLLTKVAIKDEITNNVRVRSKKMATASQEISTVKVDDVDTRWPYRAGYPRLCPQPVVTRSLPEAHPILAEVDLQELRRRVKEILDEHSITPPLRLGKHL